MVAADDEPALTSEEWADLEVLARRADEQGCSPLNVASTADHQVSTAYTAGTIVQQPGVNRWWRAEQGGVTASSTPNWPTLIPSEPIDDLYVADGTVIWEDNGGPWHPTWNLAAAAAEGWLWKAGKAAGQYQFATDGQSFSRQQIAASCREQAQLYRRRAAASLQCQ